MTSAMDCVASYIASAFSCCSLVHIIPSFLPVQDFVRRTVPALRLHRAIPGSNCAVGFLSDNKKPLAVAVLQPRVFAKCDRKYAGKCAIRTLRGDALKHRFLTISSVVPGKDLINAPPSELASKIRSLLLSHVRVYIDINRTAEDVKCTRAHICGIIGS